MSDAESILRWYLALTAVSLLLAPGVVWLGAGIGSARYALLRPAGLAALAAFVWWPALVAGLPFTRGVVLVALAIAGAAGWVIWWRRGFAGFDLRALLAFEGFWLAAFIGYVWVRGYNPDIAYTEKPMEIALLSSISRSSDVPAPDPWLAGSTINYYYFGYQSMATLVKLGGVPPVIAFNLALATLFASCATVASGIGLAIAQTSGATRLRASVAALLSPILLLLAANLETARRLARDASGTIHAGWWDGVGWRASRIIVDHGVHGGVDPRPTINEFPAFSFVLGDLHPHVLTYPLLATVLGLSVGIVLSESGRGVARLATIGGFVGLLYASNSWDAPAGLLFVLGALAISLGRDWRILARSAGAVVAGAVVVALPFLLTFHAPVGVDGTDVPGALERLPVIGTLLETFGVVAWRPSSVTELVTVHGVWLLVFAVWAGAASYRDGDARLAIRSSRDALLIAGSATAAVAIAWAPAVVFIGWPLAVAVWLALRAPTQVNRVVAGLFALGFLLVLLPEFVYIQDVFADRMNTIFKLYFQAWLVLSVATASALVQLLASARSAGRLAAAAGIVLILIVTLPYVGLSSWDWNGDFKARRGLDGSAYLDTANPADAGLITWIKANASPGDTIVEQPGCSYGVLDGAPLSRVSAFTGVPTAIGWQGHEYQWRRGDAARIALLDARVQDANAILSGQPVSLGSDADPRFLILGDQERVENSGCSLSMTRDASVVQQLQASGWVQVADIDGSLIFVPIGDPLASQGELPRDERASNLR